MPTRRRRSDHHTYTIEPAPVPQPAAQNWVQMLGSQVPLIAVLGAIVGGAVYWGQSGVKQENVQDVVKKLENKIEQVTATTATSTKEQDERRAAMAKEFLASNKEIATKVGDLAVSLAVQQATQKATSDALVKISDQLQQLNSHRAAVR